MSKYEFWWDDNNIEHISGHGVQPYEVEEVVINRPWIKRTSDGKYLAYGQTNAGRFLLVVLAPKAYNRVRPVTARDMTVAEKRRFRQR